MLDTAIREEPHSIALKVPQAKSKANMSRKAIVRTKG